MSLVPTPLSTLTLEMLAVPAPVSTPLQTSKCICFNDCIKVIYYAVVAISLMTV